MDLTWKTNIEIVKGLPLGEGVGCEGLGVKTSNIHYVHAQNCQTVKKRGGGEISLGDCVWILVVNLIGLRNASEAHLANEAINWGEKTPEMCCIISQSGALNSRGKRSKWTENGAGTPLLCFPCLPYLRGTMAHRDRTLTSQVQIDISSPNLPICFLPWSWPQQMGYSNSLSICECCDSYLFFLNEHKPKQTVTIQSLSTRGSNT